MRREPAADWHRTARAAALTASVLGALFGVACQPAPTKIAHAPSTPAIPKAAQVPAKAAHISTSELAYVLGIKVVPERDGTASTIDDYRKWIRARLTEPEIYEALTPHITSVGTTKNDVVGFLGGPAKSDKGREFYFHDADKCTDRDLVPVHPWWAPAKEILICKNDYRPEHLIGKHGKTTCDVTYGSSIHPGEECGCGPNLIFCAPGDLRETLAEAMVNEVRDTIREVVEHDRPFGEILTTNQTMRSGAADFWYDRVEFYRTGKLELPDLSKPARLVTPPEYAGGGILSTFPMLFADGPRANTASLFTDLLCAPMRSAAVTTDRLMEVAHSLAEKEADIRAEPVLALTRTEGCQNCHAKLEYGFIARGQWLPNLNGLHLSPKPPQYQTTKLYVRNQNDLRGEGPATLRWFGEMLSKQPEFPACMSRKIAGWLFEGHSVPADVMDLLVSRFEHGQNMKQLIEDALIARSFGHDAIETPARRTP